MMHAYWICRNRTLITTPRPLVMGILNVTPDSFSDGGRLADARAAADVGKHLLDTGADLLDIGGESTRPGSQPISLEEELRRVLPVVEILARETDATLSIDTTKAEVARQCLEAGAHIVNDITALTGDREMIEVVRTYQAGVALMHMQGTPATMQNAPRYGDVVAEVMGFLQSRLHDLTVAGIASERMVIDPGIGFGKTLEHNLELLARLNEFQQLGRPLLLGVSRKGLIGKILNRSLPERLAGSLAIAAMATTLQTAQILRVHDVAATRDVVLLLSTIRQAAPNTGT